MKKVGSKAVKNKKSEEENSSSEEKRIAAAMYSGLISHSDTSDDDVEPENLGKRDADKGLRSDDDKEIAEEDPDFNASDSPPDECESVSQERSKRVNTNSHQIFDAYEAGGRVEDKSGGSRKSSSKSMDDNQDDEAHQMVRLGVPQHKKVDSLDSEDRSAYSSIG